MRKLIPVHTDRKIFDTEGYALDPVERALQVKEIMDKAQEGYPEALEWVAHYTQTGVLGPIPDICKKPSERYISKEKLQSIHDNTGFPDLQSTPIEYISYPEEKVLTEEDRADYQAFMNDLILKANSGDDKSLQVLKEMDFTFAPSTREPFSKKVFESYQEHNKFIQDMEDNYYPLFSRMSSDIEQILQEKDTSISNMLKLIGRNELHRDKVSELTKIVKDLNQKLLHKDKEIDELRKSYHNTKLQTIAGGVYVEGKIPPSNIELEEIILGSAFKNGKLVEDFSQPYLDRMFYVSAHQKIHRAMMNITGKITIPKVVNKLRSQNELEHSGGPRFMEELLTKGIDDETILKEYFLAMETTYLKREAIRVSSQIINEAFTDNNTDSVVEWVRSKAIEFLDVMPYRFKIYYDLKSIVGQTIGNFHKLISRNGRPEISTGYKKLDRITHGISPGSLVFNGMRSKNGKTTLTTNIADNVAKQNRHVLIFTYESSREEITQKLIAKRAHVNLEKMSYYDDEDPLTKSEEDRIYKASKEVEALPIIIEGRPAEPEYITRMVKFYKGMYPDLSLVVIDGLQAFTKKEMPKGKNKSDYLYDTLTGFKNELAVDFNLAVWVNGQLKKEVEDRKSKRPMGSGDYSDCKGITEVADIALLGYRPGKYFEGEAYKGWIAIWPTDSRSGSEHGRACRLGIAEEYADVYELQKEESSFIPSKYDIAKTKTQK